MSILEFLVLFHTLMKKAKNAVKVIMPKNKLAFPIDLKIDKREIQLQLAKLSNITICTASNKIKHFVIQKYQK